MVACHTSDEITAIWITEEAHIMGHLTVSSISIENLKINKLINVYVILISALTSKIFLD